VFRSEALFSRPPPDGGFVYRDPRGAADGLTRIDLVTGAAGKSRTP
jgi:hypothetical protein